MRSISKPATVESNHVRSGIRIVICGLSLVALSSYSLWRASASVVAAAPATHTIVIENMKFAPEILKIRRGDLIAFKNQDLVPHTATTTKAGVFDSGVIKSGDVWTVTPTNEGTIRYACTLHPMMAGSIVVETR